MSAAASIPSSNVPPIPSDLAKLLHAPKTPWHLSPSLFEKVKKQLTNDKANGKPFAAVQVTNNDPEYAFVLRSFSHQKPPHYSIKNIFCIHNPDQTHAFEASFQGMEEAAKSFPPNWSQEEPKEARARTMERWKTSVAQFSPFQIPYSKRVDSYVHTKVLPLWHGSKQIDSICRIGFTFFGKHHFFDKSSKAGPQGSTDIGFFGSGIYFTNSSHYASMYHSDSLLLSWVSMREPYPVVNDVPNPKKGSDMLKLQGKGAYQNYNAHYIPVVSTEPSDPENMIYHPCYNGEQPTFDEHVVFEKSQALPRFVVELGVDLPVSPSSPIAQTNVKVEALTDKLLIMLDSAEVQADEELKNLLSEKSESLFNLDPQSSLSPDDFSFYNRLLKLLDPKGKVRSVIKQQFTRPRPTTQKQNTKEDPPSAAKVVKSDSTAASAVSTKDAFNQKTPAYTSNETAASGVMLQTGIHSMSLVLEALKKSDGKENLALQKAAEEGNVELCKALIATGADPFDSNTIYNAFHLACIKGKHEVVPCFLAANKYLLDATSFGENNTPLLLAIKNNQNKMVEVLLQAGANPYIHNKDLKDANSLSVSGGNFDVVLFLAANQSTRDRNGKGIIDSIIVNISDHYNALQYAANRGHAKACESLIKAGADPFITNEKGENILHLAAKNQAMSSGKSELAHEVFQVFASYKQLLNAKDKTLGRTPLLIGASNRNVKFCELLLKAGADPLIVDNIKFNVLHCAYDASIVSMVANFKQLINAQDEDGETPLVRIIGGRSDTKYAEALLAAGADPNIKNKKGRNAFDEASIWNNDGSKTQLIKKMKQYKK